MRKIICIIIALVAIFALSSCGEVQVTTDVTDIAVQTQATGEPAAEKTSAPIPDDETTDDDDDTTAVLLGVFEEYTMEGFADPFFRLSGTQVVQ